MLHFAPENFFREIFSKKEKIEYFPVDLNPKVFHLKESTDIQDLQFPDDTFDFIYCSHILEHVPMTNRQ
jgi:2-polyprenyl-3-methyl-5-hydroxy-6-metoxy-1,4-benzoquinol methylase